MPKASYCLHTRQYRERHVLGGIIPEKVRVSCRLVSDMRVLGLPTLQSDGDASKDHAGHRPASMSGAASGQCSLENPSTILALRIHVGDTQGRTKQPAYSKCKVCVRKTEREREEESECVSE